MPDDVLTRTATLAPSTLNRAARTVEATIATATPVRRRDGRGEYDEVLDISGAKLPARLPLLDSHQRGSINAVLGHADNFRIEGGQLAATLHIANDHALDLIEHGALTGVSVGYSVSEWSES